MQQIETTVEQDTPPLGGMLQTPNVRQRAFRTHDALCNYVKSFRIYEYNVRLKQDNTFEMTYQEG